LDLASELSQFSNAIRDRSDGEHVSVTFAWDGGLGERRKPLD